MRINCVQDLIGTQGFVRFEFFDGALDLLIRDVSKIGFRRWVVEIWVDSIVVWWGVEESIVQGLALAFVVPHLRERAISLFDLQCWDAGAATV